MTTIHNLLEALPEDLARLCESEWKNFKANLAIPQEFDDEDYGLFILGFASVIKMLGEKKLKIVPQGGPDA